MAKKSSSRTDEKSSGHSIIRDALAASDDGSETPADDLLRSGCSSDPLGILGCESENRNEQDR